ncbi:MAG: CpXC domain-containing protein [Anaerolineae bacterium]
MIPAQPINIRCPQCGQSFTSDVQSIVDVGENPGLKDALLGGTLNVFTCPNCGARGRLGTPLLYHDPSKELAIAYIPMELSLSGPDQEKLIGSLSNALIDALPAEKRKFYILSPRTALTWPGLIEMILEADGITREMIEEQAQRVRVLTDMIDAVGRDDALNQMIADNQAMIDYDFFLLLAGALEEAQVIGDELRARRLTKLRDRLLAELGDDASPLPAPLPENVSPSEAVDMFLALPDDELLPNVAANRPLLDYAFFQTLTGRIEAAEGTGDADEATRLKNLRERILNATETVDREMEASLRHGANLLAQILESDDPQQVVQDHLEEIDDAFLLVLSANINQAQQDGKTEIAQALEGLYAYILSRLEAELPPELQLVNRLLRIPDADQRAEVLDSEPSLVSPELADLFDRIAADSEARSRPDVAEQARTVAAEVRERLGSGAAAGAAKPKGSP